MIKRFHILFIFATVILITGCSMDSGIGFLGHSTELEISAMDKKLKEAMPIEQRGSFGRIKIFRAGTELIKEKEEIGVSVHFILTSFEIPEGIEGMGILKGTVRYDVSKKELFLADLKPIKIEFSNKSLARYVTDKAKSLLPSIISGELSLIPLHKEKDDFSLLGTNTSPPCIISAHRITNRTP